MGGWCMGEWCMGGWCMGGSMNSVSPKVERSITG